MFCIIAGLLLGYCLSKECIDKILCKEKEKPEIKPEKAPEKKPEKKPEPEPLRDVIGKPEPELFREAIVNGFLENGILSRKEIYDLLMSSSTKVAIRESSDPLDQRGIVKIRGNGMEVTLRQSMSKPMTAYSFEITGLNITHCRDCRKQGTYDCFCKSPGMVQGHWHCPFAER